jgi:hypothetical protein
MALISAPVIFNNQKILQTCVICAKYVEIHDKPKEESQCAIGHLRFDGGSIELHHPIHLACSQRIAKFTDKCPFCFQPRGLPFIIRIGEGDKERPHRLQLSLITDELWWRVQEATDIGGPSKELDFILSVCIKYIETGSVLDESRIYELIVDCLSNREWKPYGALLLFSIFYQREQFVKYLLKRPEAKEVDPTIMTAAFRHAIKNDNRTIFQQLLVCFDNQSIPDIESQINDSAITTEFDSVSIDGYPCKSSFELACHAARSAKRWDLFQSLITGNSKELISDLYVQMAWQDAAAEGNLNVLRTIATHRKEALSYEIRIRALNVSPPVDSAEIEAVILPSEAYADLENNPTLFEWALNHLRESQKHLIHVTNHTKIEHLIQYTHRFFPNQLQKWLAGVAMERDPYILMRCLNLQLPVTSDVRGKFVVSVIKSEKRSIRLLQQIFDQAALPIAKDVRGEDDETDKHPMITPRNDQYAPISRHNMSLALFEAVHSQNIDIITFLFTMSELPLDQAEWRILYNEAQGSGKNPHIITLLENTYPQHRFDSRNSEQRSLFFREGWNRFKESCRNLINWVGRGIGRVWKKLWGWFR